MIFFITLAIVFLINGLILVKLLEQSLSRSKAKEAVK